MIVTGRRAGDRQILPAARRASDRPGRCSQCSDRPGAESASANSRSHDLGASDRGSRSTQRQVLSLV